MNKLFNSSEIIKRIVKNADQTNVPEKVRQIMAGATVGSPELVSEIKSVLKSDHEKVQKMLDKTLVNLKKK